MGYIQKMWAFWTSHLRTAISTNVTGIVVLMLLILLPDPMIADDITISSNPGALIVNSATAGFEPDAVNDAMTTYSIDITTDNKKITGAIDTAMPAHTALKVTLAPPSGASSVGQVTLSTTAQDLVTGLVNGTNQSGLSITYEFSTTVDAGVITPSSKTVTFVIADSS